MQMIEGLETRQMFSVSGGDMELAVKGSEQLIALLLPAVQAAREAAHAVSSTAGMAGNFLASPVSSWPTGGTTLR